ncbi:hypothetical protein [Microbacterium sp.]|uniref:hypothetical protein n=1 Tax=Microbacterium sp. TaxID=51671 RepID=UPI003F9DF908
MPDLAVKRLHIGTEPVTASSSAVKRITGGDRRHIFQKLWKRWQAFGPEVVESGRLTEDDYVATLERNITLERGELAQGVANAIVESGYAGSARREYTRVFMRNLQQASGLVQIRDDDASHTTSLIAHVHRQTVDALR